MSALRAYAAAGVVVAIIGAFLFLHERALAPFSASQEAVPPQARLLLVGDMFFDRSIRTTAQAKGYDHLLSCVKDRFLGYDAVIGNLEGPITERKSVAVGSRVGSWQNYTFTFEPEVARLLARHNVRAVSLGNNHIENMGEEGITQTHRFLREAGVAYFGGVQVKTSTEDTMIYHSVSREPIYRTEINGERLSFVAYNQFGGMPPEDVAPRIASERAAGYFVIVMAHWGEEYVPPVAEVRRAAKLFADAGAGLIIGSHPHVVQERELIGSTPVYYSLGNFLFDQFFSEEVRHGLVVEAVIGEGRLVSEAQFATTMRQEERQVCFDADLMSNGSKNAIVNG